jgi:hypothetical protein
MQALGITAAGMLAAWEQGQGHGPMVRALALLAAAQPQASWEDLGALSLGERDRRLLELRERLFGRQLAGIASCPGCGEALDVALDGRQLRGSAGQAGAGAERELALDALVVRFRLPNSLDLLAAEGCRGVEEARRLLAERCVVAARRGGTAIAAAALTEDEVAALASAVSAADPDAEVLLDLRCPACASAWQEALDVPSFVWAELEVEARRLLREVHALARAYGWREPDILALSPWRRRLYLDMVRA